MGTSITLGSTRVLQPGSLLWLRALVWMAALLALVVGTSIVLAGIVYAGAAIAGGTPINKMMDAPGEVHFLAMLVMALASLFAYAGWVRVGEGRQADELALRPAPGELIVGLAVGGAMMSAVVLVMWAAGWATITPVTPSRVWRALGMAIESGVVEEVAMRLIVFRLLWRAFGPWTALALSALLFGILHILNPGSSMFAALCIAVEAGVMLAAFYILTGRLWVSIGVHAGWNFTQGWVFGAAVSGTDFFDGGPLDLEPVQAVPAFLSGGAFGPEASLAALVVGTGVGVATLAIARRRGRFVARDEITAAAAVLEPAA